MSKLIVILGLIALSINPVRAQQLYPRIVCSLPDTLKEASGIELAGEGIFFMHNDSGDKSVIYTTDSMGNILHTSLIANVTFIDVEDLTRDQNGNIYIADIGNNYRSRTDLRIYKVLASQLKEKDTVNAEIIRFNYPDQTEFTPSAVDHNFDAEALFCFRDTLWLLTKNHGVSGYTKIYSLPLMPGNYTANLQDSLFTRAWITSADISENGSTIALLSDSVLHLIGGFGAQSFYKGALKHYTMPFTQKEGVVFASNYQLLIVDERETLNQFGQKMYSLPIQGLIDFIKENQHLENTTILNPVRSHLIQFNLTDAPHKLLGVSLTDLNGRILFSQSNTTLENLPSIILPDSVLKGMYLLEVRYTDSIQYLKLVVE